MLEAELDTTLGYEKSDAKSKQTSNRRNGHTQKTVRSEYAEIQKCIVHQIQSKL